MDHYIFKVSQRLEKGIKEAISVCDSLNIPISKSVEFRPSFADCYFGRCYKAKKTSKRNTVKTEFVILLNERMLDEKAVIETAIHELLHTAAFEDWHGGKWKLYADLINESTHYIIRRTDNDRLGVNTKEINRGIIEAICPRCRKIIHCYKRYDTYGDTVRCLCSDCLKILYKTLPESPLMNIDDTSRRVFVGDLTDKEILSSFMTLAPYTDEKTTAEIFFRALDGIEDFSQFKIVEPLKRICDFVSKNTAKKILNELYIRLINGRYDNKICNYEGYVAFTGFFALTRFYEPSCHYLRKYDPYISH